MYPAGRVGWDLSPRDREWVGISLGCQSPRGPRGGGGRCLTGLVNHPLGGLGVHMHLPRLVKDLWGGGRVPRGWRWVGLTRLVNSPGRDEDG